MLLKQGKMEVRHVNKKFQRICSICISPHINFATCTIFWEGQLLLIENIKSSNVLLSLYQDATVDTAAKMGGKGCVSNQDVRSFIIQTDGLTLVSEREYASGVFRSFVCVR